MDFNKLLAYIPGFLGFILLILVGLLMAIHGFANPLGASLTPGAKAGFQMFGLCAVAIGAVSWIIGGTSKIAGREGTVGVKVKITDLPWWGYLIDVGAFVVCLVIFLIRTV